MQPSLRHRPTRMRSRISLVFLTLAVTSATRVHAQQAAGVIIGTITDESHRPLAGAEVTLEGTPRRASAIRDGSFLLTDVADGSQRLIARYIGYLPETLSVN